MKKNLFILLVSLLISISIGLSLYIYNNNNNDDVKNHQIVYDLELELEYWKIKAELVDSIQNYINKIAPSSDLSGLILLNECIEANVDVAFALAQGQKESHYGTRGLGAKTNNVFNVGAYDGHNYKQIHKIHKYDHPNESVKPYLKLLNSKYLVNGKTEQDLLCSFVDINGKRYASYTKYEEELKNVINKINKSKINSLYNEFLNLETKLNY